MLREEIDAIIGGYHGDPFRLLGPHAVQQGKAWEVRAFLPQAREVLIVRGEKTFTMRKEAEGGLWVAELQTPPGVYRLRLTLYSGETQEIDDPYRFWPVLSEYDLHLHAEGTLYRAWETLGSHQIEVDGVIGVLFAVWAPTRRASASPGT